MRYRINHTTKYAYGAPVAVCHNLVRLAPREVASQRLASYGLMVAPEPDDLVRRTDALGNQVDYFSIERSHAGLTLSATSEVTVDPIPVSAPGRPWEAVRDELSSEPPLSMPRQFALPSAQAPVGPELAGYALGSFTPGRPIVEALRDLTSRIHRDFDYNPEATTVSTPVRVAFAARAGVCQDFAHVGIACLRSIGLAARYVSGYLRTLPPPGKPRLVGADASHAWLSLYCGRAEEAAASQPPARDGAAAPSGEAVPNSAVPADAEPQGDGVLGDGVLGDGVLGDRLLGDGGWVDADPTNDRLIGADHITIAHGRDYADVCPIQGVYVGGGDHTLSVSVDVAPLG